MKLRMADMRSEETRRYESRKDKGKPSSEDEVVKEEEGKPFPSRGRAGLGISQKSMCDEPAGGERDRRDIGAMSAIKSINGLFPFDSPIKGGINLVGDQNRGLHTKYVEAIA